MEGWPKTLPGVGGLGTVALAAGETGCVNAEAPTENLGGLKNGESRVFRFENTPWPAASTPEPNGEGEDRRLENAFAVVGGVLVGVVDAGIAVEDGVVDVGADTSVGLTAGAGCWAAGCVVGAAG